MMIERLECPRCGRMILPTSQYALRIRPHKCAAVRPTEGEAK